MSDEANSFQTNLEGHTITAGQVVNGRVVSKIEADKYNSFYKRAFVSGEIEEIIEKGGSVNLENFKTVTKGVMQNNLYWEAMFQPNKTFTGRDKIVRKSKFQGALGSVIFGMFPKDDRINFIKYTRNKKEYTMPTVVRGKKITFEGKTYRGGSFLPKKFL